MDRSYVIFKGNVFDQSQKIKENVEGIQVVNTALNSYDKRMYLMEPSPEIWDLLIELSLDENVKGIVMDILNNDGYSAEIEAYLEPAILLDNKWTDKPCEIFLSESHFKELLKLSL